MIQIDKLNFSYSRHEKLFHELELSLEPGKIYGLLGKNGTGKSTLLKLIMGALHPKDGKITLDNYLASDRDPSVLQNIYFLSEDYELPAITIANYLKAYSGFYPKFDNSKFEELLQLFELPNKGVITKLSYGQKKKLLIAFGIATNAQYLLMDEPTNGLDIPSKSQFRKALLSGFKANQIVLISTHQIRDLNQLIESIIVIEEGRIIFNKDVFELEEKLYFHKSLSDSPVESELYSEGVVGGYIHVLPNNSGEASELELEVLFNALIKDSNVFNNYL